MPADPATAFSGILIEEELIRGGAHGNAHAALEHLSWSRHTPENGRFLLGKVKNLRDPVFKIQKWWPANFTDFYSQDEDS